MANLEGINGKRGILVLLINFYKVMVKGMLSLSPPLPPKQCYLTGGLYH